MAFALNGSYVSQSSFRSQASLRSETIEKQLTTTINVQDQIQEARLMDRKKLIDFKKLSKNHSKITDQVLPFTEHHIEDVVFIKKRNIQKLITLEYIFYDANEITKYTKLRKLPQIEKDHNPTESATTFDRVPHEYVGQKIDYLESKREGVILQKIKEIGNINRASVKNLKALKPDVKFMKYLEEKDDTGTEHNTMVEALISVWQVTKQGQMRKIKQTSFEYQPEYIPTNDKNMRLQLSHDSRYVSLGIIKNNKLTMMAWSTITLEPLVIQPSLQSKLTLNGKFVELTIIGDSQYVLLTQKISKLINNQEHVSAIHYRIFSLQTSALMFEYVNEQSGDNISTGTHIYCIGLLFHKKTEKEVHDISSDDDASENLDHDEDEGLHDSSDEDDNMLKDVMAKLRQTITMKQPKTPSESGESDPDNEEIINEGGEQTLNLVMSAFFATDIHLARKELHKNEQIDDWHGIRLQVDLSERNTSGNFVGALKQEATDLFNKLKSKEETQIQLYDIPKNWMVTSLGKLDNYLKHVSIVSNRRANFFGWLNQKRKLFLAYCQSLKNERVKLLDQHKYTNLTDAEGCHTRNPQTKDHLFLHLQVGNENWVEVFFDEIADELQMRLSKPVVDMRKLSQDYLNQMSLRDKRDAFPSLKLTMRMEDTVKGHWTDAIYHYHDKVIQGISLSKAWELKLKTSAMVGQIEGEKQWKQNLRFSYTQRFQTSFPIIAYNIGIKKLIFQMTMGANKTVVHELPPNEIFIDFLQYSSLQDLNFQPKDHIYDACSSFVFLTQKRTRKGPKFVVNLMMIDPYFKREVFALFKTHNSWDKPINSLPIDEIKNCIIYSTKSTSGGQNQNIRVLLQYNNKIEFIQMTDQRENLDDGDDQPSDVDEFLQQEFLEEEEYNLEEKQLMKYEQVKAIINERGDIYYVTNFEGQCTVWEINSFEIENHAKRIYEIRANECLGFSVHDKYLYFIDDTKTINKLVQSQETRQLDNVEDLYIKEQDKPNFGKIDFATTIVRDEYMVFNSGVYYLYKFQPLQDGILDYEELLESYDNEELDYENNNESKYCLHAAIQFKGSEKFVLMYQNGDRYDFSLQVSQLPDSMHVTIIQDQLKQVDMVTFLEHGQILLKLGQRFMQFNDNGNFINEVDFKQSPHEKLTREKSIIQGMAQQFQTVDKKVQMQKNTSLAFLNQIEREARRHKYSKQTNLHLMHEIAVHRSMKLLQMSDDSKYYLFEDMANKSFNVYQIQRKEYHGDTDLLEAKSDFDDHHMEFIELYELPWSESEVLKQIEVNVSLLNFKGLAEKVLTNITSKKLISEFEDISWAIKEKMVKTCIDNQANVVFIYCEEPQQIEIPLPMTNMTVMGCKFERKENGTKTIDFKQKIDFPNKPMKDVDDMLDEDTRYLDHLMNIEQKVQKRLPGEFKNPYKLQKLQQQLDMINIRRQMRYSATIIGKYLIVQCGRFIKTAIFEEKGTGKKAENFYQEDESTKGLSFQMLNLNFPTQYEVTRLLSIGFKQKSGENFSDDLIQIVAKNNHDNIMIVVTWNCESNIEYSMFQHKCEKTQNPENYIVRGMNNKLNYFIDEHQVFDLEFEIPQQKVIQNPLTGDGIGYKFQNQRKIFWNTSRILSIENQNMIQLPYTHRDLQFWQNIHEQNGDHTLIAENTVLSQFNQVFDSHSLFHYFAKDRKVIKELHSKYVQLRDDEDVQKLDFNTPLIMLTPNLHGKTALDIAIENDRLVCFELMLDMLEDYNQKCLSKMMLSCMPHMILARSEVIYKYFNTCLYKPYSMTSDFRIPWPHQIKEVIFASHTVLISEDMILNQISKTVQRTKYFGSSSYLNETTKWLNKVDQTFNQATQAIQNFGKDDRYKKLSASQDMSKSSLQDQMKLKRKVLRKQVLDEELESKTEKASIKRISLECLDFDWIFNVSVDADGNERCNTMAMLGLLSEHDVDNRLYKQTSIRIFVSLLWSEYRPQIIRWKLIPFVIYMGVQLFVTLFGSNFIDEIKEEQQEKKHGDKVDTFDEYYVLWMYRVIVICCFFCQVYWVNNTYSEIKEIMRDGINDYFKDVWNYLDFAITVVSQAYMIQLMTNLLLGDYFRINFMRTSGGVTLFLLWIKIFYWMRLFNKTAYFIKLIEKTLRDLREFFYIILIIMTAFISIFYIFSTNLPAKDRSTDGEGYLDNHTGNKVVDSMITIYFITVGEFYLDNYSKMPNNQLIWPMFIACNFLMAIVFMNMLIAIMGESFNQVNSTKVESSLEQQIALMTDYEDLVDTKKKFQGKKYIIHALPAVTETSVEVDLEEAIDQLSINTTKSFNRRLDEREKNQILNVKHQNSKISQIQRSINNILNQTTGHKQEQE